MLIPCPECGTKVSDRAKACINCGFPVAEHVAEQNAAREAEQDRKTRTRVGEVDCPHCKARGFVMLKPEKEGDPETFYWCDACEHTGRVALCRSDRGYWAVDLPEVEAFLAGRDVGDNHAHFLGKDAPEGHRYEKPGPSYEE